MNKKIVGMVVSLGLLAGGEVMAQDVKADNFYVGAGVGVNDLDPYDNAVGFQFFGGFDFKYKLADVFNTAVEAGYMTTGDFEVNNTNNVSVDGVWATGVATYPLNKAASLIGRLGLDLGDDDGLLWGFGVGYRFKPQLEVRGEYAIRDNVNSLQANLVYYLK